MFFADKHLPHTGTQREEIFHGIGIEAPRSEKTERGIRDGFSKSWAKQRKPLPVEFLTAAKKVSCPVLVWRIYRSEKRLARFEEPSITRGAPVPTICVIVRR